MTTEGAEPTEGPAKPKRVRSLIWILPERRARLIGWSVVFVLCMAPLAVIWLMVSRQSPEYQQSLLVNSLRNRLCVPAEVAVTTVESPGFLKISDLSIGEAASAVSLRSKKGSYLSPRRGMPGHLDLEGGNLELDLAAWAGNPSAEVLEMLRNLSESNDLSSITASSLTARFHLFDSPLTITEGQGRAEFSAGTITANISGKSPFGRTTATISASKSAHSITVESSPLPWMQPLLTPTLGETLTNIMEGSSGKVTITNNLPGKDNWELDMRTVLDLARLPESLGLDRISGRIHTLISGWGELHGHATVTITFTLAGEGQSVVTRKALRNIIYLATGSDLDVPPEDAVEEVRSMKVKVHVTRVRIYINGYLEPQKSARLTFDETLPIDTFMGRLEKLGREWREANSS